MRSFKSTVLAVAAAAGLMLAATAPARADYVQPHITHPAFGRVRVVVPVTSADPAVWKFKLLNLVNSEKTAKQWHGTLQAHVVLYGGGVKMLLRPVDDDVKQAVDQLRADGVRFDICNNTLKGMNLDWHELYGVQERDIVPAGFLQVGWLADHGWAVEAMN
jgi:intracellular sulfur oxidation DsrE/DsrF family protein